VLLDELTNIRNKILIVGAHPDDVEFSCGRLLLRRKGRNSYIICMTDGSKGQEGTMLRKTFSEKEYVELREKESRKALKELNVDKKNIFFYKLPDQELVSNPYIIDKLYLLLKKTNLDYILIPPWEGAHPDHDTTHLFMFIVAENVGFNKNKIIEYGSYNNYDGKFTLQQFIPFENINEERLIPTPNEQKRWLNIMKIFKTQKNQQKHYIPKSKFENFRILPTYEYSKLPYSRKHSKIIRQLLNPVYLIARKILPNKDKLFYETWTSINPEKIKEKLHQYIEHYVIK
jgi:LmbE family N-acetylglucosaminyl deacetylase